MTPRVHLILDDFRALYQALHSRPTRIQELVPLLPTVHGAHDAASHGTGGVLLPNPTTVAWRITLRVGRHAQHKITQLTPNPIVWRMPFPDNVASQLSTYSNPPGTITNTDLALVGSIIQADADARCFALRERTHLRRTLAAQRLNDNGQTGQRPTLLSSPPPVVPSLCPSRQLPP